MSFSLPRFLRHTPPVSLRRYFAGRQITLPCPVDWAASHADLLGTLQQVIEALDETTREQVFSDLERANSLQQQVDDSATSIDERNFDPCFARAAIRRARPLGHDSKLWAPFSYRGRDRQSNSLAQA